MTSLCTVADGKLRPAVRRAISKESMIGDLVAADLALLGLDALVIGRQVPTDHGEFIDPLATDATGGLIIIELKKVATFEAELSLSYSGYLQPQPPKRP